MRCIGLLVIVGFLAGCADSHQLVRSESTPASLNKEKSIYIAVPKDGTYGHITYQGSGANAAQILLMAFSKYTENVETGYHYKSFEDASDYASEKQHGYLVFPTILEWEDRATQWSGIPDKVAIKIAIVNVETGKTLDSAIIKGKSGLATFGGDRPQDLLPEPVEEYVSTLFK